MINETACASEECCAHGLALSYYNVPLRLRKAPSSMIFYADEAQYVWEFLRSSVPGGTFDALRALFKKYEGSSLRDRAHS